MKAVLLKTKNLKKEPSGNHYISNEIKFEITGFIETGSVIIEVEEGISENGQISLELKESIINNVLRQIFALKPSTILIAFNNSSCNAVHEKTMQNLLHTAGYKSVFISSDRERFISNLSVMFAKLKDELFRSI